MDAYRFSPYIIFLVLGLLASCVKDPQDIPGSSTDDEIFGIQGSFGNEILNIGAGTNQWTNLPVTEKADSLQTYISVFSLNGCLDNCPSSWRFTFYQALPGLNDEALDFDNTIRVGEKAILASEEERKEYDVLLSTHPGLFMSGYSYWEDLNGPASSFFDEYHTTIGYGEIMDICFQSMAYSGCLYKQCISFDPTTEVPCLGRIEPKLENPRYLSLNLKPTGTGPFEVLWSNGATTFSRVIPLQDSVAEVYAQVTVTDALGNSSELAQTIRVQNGIVDACYFPIQLESHPKLDNASSLFENRVEIQYTDESGVLWSSSGVVQPAEAQFIINDKSEYGLSPSNEASYLVEMTADVVLFNQITGESKVFKANRLSLALSHP